MGIDLARIDLRGIRLFSLPATRIGLLLRVHAPTLRAPGLGRPTRGSGTLK